MDFFFGCLSFVYLSFIYLDLKILKNKDFDGCDHRDHQELPKDDEELMHNLK